MGQEQDGIHVSLVRHVAATNRNDASPQDGRESKENQLFESLGGAAKAPQHKSRGDDMASKTSEQEWVQTVCEDGE